MNKFLNSTAPVGMIDASATVGENMDKLALSLAAVATPNLDAAVSTVVAAKGDWDMGPITIMTAVMEDYTLEQLQSFPDPDVKTGNNPSVYMVPVYKDGKRQPKDKEVNWYNRFADGRPASAAIVQRIEWVVRAGNEKMKKDDIPQDILDMNPDLRDQEKTKLSNKLANNRGAVVKAFRLLFKIKAVNALEGCNCYVVPGKEEGTFDNLIHVNSTVKGRETVDYDNLSIGTFNKLDTAKAKEGGGSFKALLATKKRQKGSDEQENEGDAKPQLIRTIDTLQARTTDYAEYFDTIQAAKDKAEWMLLLKTLGPKGPAGSEQFKLELFSIHQTLNSIYNQYPEIKREGERLFTADATGETAAA